MTPGLRRRTALLGAVGIAGAIAHWAVSKRALIEHPPPGKLVAVDRHRLHLHCKGAGPATVVCESALGGWSIDWDCLRPHLATHARMCTYDRAGYGWSDAAGRSYTPRETAQELHTLLRSAEVPPPYVLVGHSAGALYVRQFALLYPDAVAGMVLVDPTHEQLLARLPPNSAAFRRTRALKHLRWLRFVTVTGVTRLFRLPVASMPDLPAEQRATASALGYRFASYDAFYKEAVSVVAATSTELDDLSSPDVPVIVLTSSENASKPDTGPTWLQLHDEIAAAYARGTRRTIEGGHFLQIERPEEVAAAVLEVIDQTRLELPR